MAMQRLDRLGEHLAAVVEGRLDDLVEAACVDLRCPVADTRRRLLARDATGEA